MASAILPIISGLGSIFGNLFGASNASQAAQTASGQEQTATGNAINSEQGNLANIAGGLSPWSSMGLSSMSGLMQMLQNGTYGAGSLPMAPNAPGAFQAPTAAEAAATPGYQFTQQQGQNSLLKGAAAAGGAISGGTMKALDSYTTGLADSTYGNTFNRSLQSYQANLADYNAQLGQYQAYLGAQNQMFNQNYLPATAAGQMGLSATNTNSQIQAQGGLSIANLMNLLGQEQAAGTLGSSKALVAGLGGALQAGTNPGFLSGLGSLFGGSSGGGSSPTGGG